MSRLSVALMALVMLGGCSRFLYTREEWGQLQRRVEAVEEELDDLSKDSEAHRRQLDGYVAQIDEMERERKLYDQAMSRVREAFFQDLDETARRMEDLDNTMDRVEAADTRYSTGVATAIENFEKEWVERYEALLKVFCAHWKCEDEDGNDKNR